MLHELLLDSLSPCPHLANCEPSQLVEANSQLHSRKGCDEAFGLAQREVISVSILASLIHLNQILITVELE